jgi:biotin synthase-like enzyme
MILVVNPKLIVQRHDTFTTGIVYMPVSLAYICGGLQQSGVDYKVIDLFGEKPTNVTEGNGFWSFGANLEDVVSKDGIHPSHVLIFANQAANHSEIISTVSQLRNSYPLSRILVLENSQAVTAYSLTPLKGIFLGAGANDVLVGDPFIQAKRLLEMLGEFEFNSEEVLPDWSQFPLKNYWKAKLSHGPQTSESYLPILTSFGCPWGCSFCVIPATNNRKWVTRSTSQISREISFVKQVLGVKEFHFEDLNSTVSTKRIREIATAIKPLEIDWKIVAGTKAETLDSFETLRHLKTSGLSYFSFSPESGSRKIRRIIDKRFDVKHSLSLITWSRRLKIRSQACFIMGMPGENRIDRFKSLNLIRLYTMLGISEVAIFIISPMPGSALFSEYKVDLDSISFSPDWRKDYKKLSAIRIYWYLNFLVFKCTFHPIEIVRSVVRFVSHQFVLKMEIAPYRSRQWKRWARRLN